MKVFRKSSFIILLSIICANSLSAQDFIFPDFETHPPIREMKCGLWINAVGDIAYKTIGCEPVAVENEYAITDTLVVINDFAPSDYYITWCYYVRDSIMDETTASDYDYMAELKNVVDTASFKILSLSYFMDKNHFYNHILMACGGHIGVNRGIDRKTFKVFKSNPNFACDKYNCFVMGRTIEGADPKTFQPIINEEFYLYSRDKNHIYNTDQPMTDAEIIETEKDLGFKLFTQADVMNFTAEKFDSVKIVFGIDHNKEISDVLDEQTENYFEVKGSGKLTPKEISTLNGYLLSPQSFTDTVSLLSHGDISISYYRGDTVAVYCSISSLTRRFTLINGVRTFEKSISLKFEKYITGLLRSKNIWTKKQRFYDFEE